MGFFDDDPFEEIINEFLGGRNRDSRVSKRIYSDGEEEIIKGEEEERYIDFIEDEKKVYVIFELPGYSEKDVSVILNGKELSISVKKKQCDVDKMQNYLNKKFCKGMEIKKNLPKFISTKKFSHTMKNGILEVVFERK